VIGHLIHGDKTDWLLRVELILSDNTNKAFATFDRFAQFENSKGKNLAQLLQEFTILRQQCTEQLRKLNISTEELLKTGIHPQFGEVTLSQLLSTWVVHDLDHIAQIARVMAKQYKEEVGPWIEYLKVLRS
jgi:DinB superfamily